MMPPALEIQNVSARYNGKRVLSDVDFAVRSGERIAVVGPNGAGKSTLFKLIVGLIPHDTGDVLVHGHSHHAGDCPSLGYVPQREDVDWTFPVSVSDVVLMGRTRQIGWLRWPSGRDHGIVREALRQVGMESLVSAPIGELSGGQQQRVFIARALAQEADILLLDEPLSGVDPQTQASLFETLDQLRQRGVTVLLATHDLELATARFDKVLMLSGRVVAFGQPAEVFTPQALAATYGQPFSVLPG